MRRSPLAWSLTISTALATLGVPFSDACADAKAGEKKAQLCLLCHRFDSSIGAPTLEQQPSRYLVAQINAFKSGKRTGAEMPVNVANLSAKDIQDIADYFSSQRAKQARSVAQLDSKLVELGAASATKLNCASCHAEDYRGGKDNPRLAGQASGYLGLKISEFKRGARTHPAIPAVASQLGDREIEALGAYFGSLSP
jgi:cytochrome c553